MSYKIDIKITTPTKLVEAMAMLGAGPQQFADIVEGRAQTALRAAKYDAPIDTGALRGRITMRPANQERTEFELKSSVFYAPYVEFGTGSKVFNSSGAKRKYTFSALEQNYASQFRGFKRIAGQNAQPHIFVNVNEQQRRINNDIIQYIEKETGQKLR